MDPWVGVSVVPSQAVHEFRSPAVRTAASSSTFFIPGNVVSICDSPAFLNTFDDERVEGNRDGLGFARGLRVAFLLEAGAIVLVYGLWHLWHLVQ
jgi:hypothetical protein